MKKYSIILGICSLMMSCNGREPNRTYMSIHTVNNVSDHMCEYTIQYGAESFIDSCGKYKPGDTLNK